MVSFGKVKFDIIYNILTFQDVFNAKNSIIKLYEKRTQVVIDPLAKGHSHLVSFI